MNKSCKIAVALAFVLSLSTAPLFAQPYSFDGNGNGTQFIAFNPYPLPFQVAPDPTGGITTSPVLIYSLGEPVVSGDVALVGPDGSGILDLLRFFTPAGGANSDLIVYSQPNGTLAGVGIPSSADPVQISLLTPSTTWRPTETQPGATTLYAYPEYDIFSYTLITAPEPSPSALLLIGAGISLAACTRIRFIQLSTRSAPKPSCRAVALAEAGAKAGQPSTAPEAGNQPLTFGAGRQSQRD